MLYKLVATTDPIPDATDYNTFPIGWHEITAIEFTQITRFHAYHFAYTEYRQMHRNADGTQAEEHIHAHLYWYADKTGWCMYPAYWDKKVRFFVFGCTHQWRELSQAECRKRGFRHWGTFCHISECQKCGYIEGIDSSG